MAKKLLTEAAEIIQPGTSTGAIFAAYEFISDSNFIMHTSHLLVSDEIDKFILKSCLEHGAYPSPLNYRGFPKSVCTSVNNCVCHGIPDLRPMKDGDIVRFVSDTYF